MLFIFKNKQPYCSFKVLSGRVNQPIREKIKFNPVKRAFILLKSGDSKFIEYNFNTHNHYLTPIEVLHNPTGEILEKLYVGHDGSGQDYEYEVVRQLGGTQRIQLRSSREECNTRRPPLNIIIKSR